MDDFKVILGNKFMREVMMILIPALRTVCILEKGATSMIPTIERRSDGMRRLLTIQITKAVKKGLPKFKAKLGTMSQAEGNTMRRIRGGLDRNPDTNELKAYTTKRSSPDFVGENITGLFFQMHKAADRGIGGPIQSLLRGKGKEAREESI